MAHAQVEINSETLRILCGPCLKTATIHWVDFRHALADPLVHISCHNKHRLVVISEMTFLKHINRHLPEKAPPLAISWEQLEDWGTAADLKSALSEQVEAVKRANARIEAIKTVLRSMAGEIA